jgi:arsenate reductase-like glutaredoxin family protein
LRLSDEDRIDAMEDHPSLIAAPIVVTPDAVCLCRSPDEVAGLLPDAAAKTALNCC